PRVRILAGLFRAPCGRCRSPRRQGGFPHASPAAPACVIAAVYASVRRPGWIGGRALGGTRRATGCADRTTCLRLLTRLLQRPGECGGAGDTKRAHDRAPP